MVVDERNIRQLQTIVVISTVLSALTFTMLVFNYNSCLFPPVPKGIDKLNTTCVCEIVSTGQEFSELVCPESLLTLCRSRLVLLGTAIFLFLSATIVSGSGIACQSPRSLLVTMSYIMFLVGAFPVFAGLFITVSIVTCIERFAHL